MSQHSLTFLHLNSMEDLPPVFLYIKVQEPLARCIHLRPMYIYIGLSISTLDIVLPTRNQYIHSGDSKYIYSGNSNIKFVIKIY